MQYLSQGSLKALGLSALLLLQGCSGCCGWISDSSCGQPPTMNSARLYLPPAGGCGGLELELVRTYEGIRFYLNVFGLEIPPDPCDKTVSQVFISFRERSYTFVADRFAGGQRLLIPNNVRDDIVNYLQEGQPVFIRVDRYQADIFPERFLPSFNRMIGAPL